MTATKKDDSFRPTLDVLEDRSLMTGGITTSYMNGVLYLIGTAGADRIHVRANDTTLAVDGIGSAPLGLFNAVVVLGQGGDDVIGVSGPAALGSKTYVLGGDGRDSLVYDHRAMPAYIHSDFETFFNTGVYVDQRWVVDANFSDVRGEFEVMAGANPTYNCIAWSLGRTDMWINPPQTWAQTDAQNASYGYTRMSNLDTSLQPGYEKIVLYGKVDQFGNVIEFTHQARQQPDGSWSRKLGQSCLIRHTSPEALNSAIYGVPVAVYIRPIAGTA